MANLRCTTCGRYVNGPEDHARGCPLFSRDDAYLPTRVERDGRVLDYVPRLDERNNLHLVRHVMTAANANWGRSAWWTGGRVLDQGAEGACVGFAVAGEYGASPVRGFIGNDLARFIYGRAKEIDEWEGVDYEGTSVRAGMLVGRERGWWDGFRWAKNMDELLVGLQNWGPVVVGVEWKEGMYETRKDGIVRAEGEVVGGHAILITGYSPRYGSHGKRFRWRNSWGPSYGVNGNGYISPADLEKILFGAGGEAAVIEKRSLR